MHVHSKKSHSRCKIQLGWSYSFREFLKIQIRSDLFSPYLLQHPISIPRPPRPLTYLECESPCTSLLVLTVVSSLGSQEERIWENFKVLTFCLGCASLRQRERRKRERNQGNVLTWICCFTMPDSRLLSSHLYLAHETPPTDTTEKSYPRETDAWEREGRIHLSDLSSQFIS